MKLVLKFLPILTCLILIAGCETDKETANLSRVTFYPNFTFNGDETLVVPCGSPFVDPGVTATENGVDLPITTTVAGYYFGGTAVNTDGVDFYGIDYKATNKDGYAGAQHRDVIVSCSGDLVNSIEGIYTSTVTRNGKGGAQYTDMKYILIKKIGANQYALSDGIGGYYDFGRGYGPDYAAKGIIITANNIAANDFSFNGPVPVGAFGGALTIDSVVVDAANKKIVIKSTWTSGFAFEFTLTQVNL